MNYFFGPIKYSNRLISILTLSFAISSCGGGDNDDGTMGGDDDNNMMVINRLLQEVFDQVSFTASFMLDTDQDGDDDIILGPANGRASDMLLVNDGSGFFEIQVNAFPTRYQGTNGQTVNITSADFNNDGRPDIIANTIDAREGSFSQSAQIHLYLNKGNNTFTDGTNQITNNLIAIGWVEWIRVGDFNNDGNLDFVTTSAGGFGMDTFNGIFQGGYIYLNDGNANFNRTIIRMKDNSALGEYTHEVLAWDEVEDAEARIGRYPLDIFAGDVDNDGDTDLVAPNGYAGSQWATFINVSTGTEASFEVVLNSDVTDTNGSTDPDEFDRFRFKNGALMDINGDGFLDVVGSVSIAGLSDPPVPVLTFLNNGSGQFSLPTDLITGTAPGLVHARQWLVADFNNDGIDDLLIADHGEDIFNFPGFPNTLLIGSPAGTLTNSSSRASLKISSARRKRG